MNSKVAAYNGLDIDSQAGAVNPGEAVFGDAACGQVIKINWKLKSLGQDLDPVEVVFLGIEGPPSLPPSLPLSMHAQMKIMGGHSEM